jgi:hypothetical protein
VFDWLRRQFGWSSHIRVRVADIGPEACAVRRLIRHWLPEGPDLSPALRLGRVEIVVLHHVRAFGDAGPVTPALTERSGSLTRVAVGRFRAGAGPAWQPYGVAEILTALELHLQALARDYAEPTYWFPGVEALVTPAERRDLGTSVAARPGAAGAPAGRAAGAGGAVRALPPASSPPAPTLPERTPTDAAPAASHAARHPAAGGDPATGGAAPAADPTPTDGPPADGVTWPPPPATGGPAGA